MEIARTKDTQGSDLRNQHVKQYSGQLIGGAGAVAVVYALLAWLGLVLDPVGGFASVVWAPSGVAIAAVLLMGLGVTPGIWLGAFAANLFAGAPVAAAAAVAAGNTLAAVLAATLLARVRPFDRSLGRLHDVVLFALLAAVLAAVVSSTAGVGSLTLAGVVPRADAGAAWRAWWLGDCIGALLVAPAILVWRARGWRDLTPRAREAAIILVALAAVCVLVFFVDTGRDQTAFLQTYLVFPVLIWAAMRFEQRGAVTAVLLTSALAVTGTARGGGPFAQPQLSDSLFALQAFMGIVAISMLTLATAIAERERASRTASQLLTAASVANHAKSDFLIAMSHELRTPLNAIAGYAQLLAMNVHGQLTPEQRDAVQRIETNQRHLAALVADVLSFTRMESGRLALQASTVGVADSLHALSQFVAPEADRKAVEIHIAPIPDGLAVHADADRTRQILLNLLVNAIKFSGPGGRVSLSASPFDGKVRIVVQDHGIGIPREQLQRVFEPFFQVEQGHSRRYPGIGLGLTISRDLARAMGGDILIESEHGKGTTATLVLPTAGATGEGSTP